MRTLLTIVLLLVVVIVLAFAVVNSHPVQLNYYAGAVQLPLALVLIITLTLGFMIGVAAMSLRLLRLRWELSGVRKRLRDSEQLQAEWRKTISKGNA